MAGGNPVFDRLNKQIEKERYAGFGEPQRGHQPASRLDAGGDGRLRRAGRGHGPAAQRPVRPAVRRPVDTGRVTLDDVIIKGLVPLRHLAWRSPACRGSGSRQPQPDAAPLAGWHVRHADPRLRDDFMKSVSVPLYLRLLPRCRASSSARSATSSPTAGVRGVVLTAVVATLCVFVAMYIGYATGLIKVTAKTRADVHLRDRRLRALLAASGRPPGDRRHRRLGLRWQRHARHRPVVLSVGLASTRSPSTSTRSTTPCEWARRRSTRGCSRTA